MKVFILEDDPQRMLYLRELLYGADITHIDSCREAGKFQPPYDLILLDHDLGGRQLQEHEDCGTTFARLVKNKINPDATVVIHSYNHDGAQRMWDILEHHAHIAPFRGREFNTILQQVLRGQAAAAAKAA